MTALRPQPHEVGPAFGPCEGPMLPDGGSFLCRGFGTLKLDPADEGLRQRVLCTPCAGHREDMVITAALESVIGKAA
ncbi:MAG TPA: hypothetical protein VFU47_14315 [Armatimonadota bacterium]|nr:hypothetical protein [Armatimonadota bacterium]